MSEDTPRKYDPATCVTARELREIGLPIPEDIPDVAWCHRSALHVALNNVEDKGNGVVYLKFEMIFDQPLEWIQLDFTVEA